MTAWIEYVGFPEGTFSYSVYTWSIILLWLSVPLLYVVLGNLSYIRSTYRQRSKIEISKDINEVVIVVLGDLGHSPRMSYHARSFANAGYSVNLCGYLESNLPGYLSTPGISIYDIPVIKNKRNLPYLIFAVLKVLSQFYDLTSLLAYVIDGKTRYVLIQNPPSLPVVLIVGLLKKFWAPQVQIIIDWHNLNWSILNLKYQNEGNWVVKLMKAYEKFCCQKISDFNFTVTAALKEYLIENFKAPEDKVITFYDRPSDIFAPLDSQDSLQNILQANSQLFDGISYNQLSDRILVTSTSFTQDEDFTVLVEALVLLEKKLKADSSKHRIIMLVTGKGPLQADFLKLVKQYRWEFVFIKNVWLPIKEYPNILKVADLGISLHYSSSGLDLPMKIVDLFGSGIPVLTMNYPVIKELVKDNINGLILKSNNNADEMATKIFNVLFQDNELYKKLKRGALLESRRHWNDEWNDKLVSKLSLNNVRPL